MERKVFVGAHLLMCFLSCTFITLLSPFDYLQISFLFHQCFGQSVVKLQGCLYVWRNDSHVDEHIIVPTGGGKPPTSLEGLSKPAMNQTRIWLSSGWHSLNGASPTSRLVMENTSFPLIRRRSVSSIVSYKNGYQFLQLRYLIMWLDTPKKVYQFSLRKLLENGICILSKWR